MTQMNRFILLAFALAFTVPASDAVVVPLVSNVSHAYNPHALCDAIQALEHDICSDVDLTVAGKAHNTPLALLCGALSELNSTLCSSDTIKNINIPVQKVCPLLEFIDTEICPNSTNTGGSAATDSHTPTLILAHAQPVSSHIHPAEFCPIIKLFDEEICGQAHSH
jgi:hypothetical protein